MSPDRDQLDDQQFVLAVKRLADSLVYGSDESPYRGSGVDYVQSRLYSAGDPVKSIDWRVTARTGKVYVKEFESLKHVPVWLVVDQSVSMRVSSIRKSKWDWAVLLTGALALAATNRASPAALFATGNASQDDARPLRQQPSLSREEIYHCLRILRQMTPNSSARMQISRTLLELEVAARERSMIFLLSDLHEENLAGPIKRLAQKHEVVLLRLQDPSETLAPVRGFFRGMEAETGFRFTARSRRMLAAFHDLNAEVRNAGVDTITLRTDTDFVPALREFLRTRGVFRNGGAR